MKFYNYNKFIKDNENTMTNFIIYYYLKVNNYIDDLNENDIVKLINFIEYVYLKDENYINLELMCIKASQNKTKILNDNFTKWDLLSICYE